MLNANATHHKETVMGTLSGTALTVAVNIQSEELLKTAVLAAVGAAVSFGMTLLLKRLSSFRKRKSGK